MTPPTSRKHFFAKLLGFVAASSVWPKLIAQPAREVPAGPERPASSLGGIEIRSEPRAVARRAESI